jgi:hypothetical protein
MRARQAVTDPRTDAPAPWAPPEERGSSGGRAAPAELSEWRGGPGAATARGDAPELPRNDRVAGVSPLGALRPVGPGAVLDGGFALLRARFRRIVALAALFFIPIRLFDLVTMIATGDVVDRVDIGPSALVVGGGSGWSWVVILLQSIALSLLGLCVGHLASRLSEGDDPAFGALAALALRRGWVALLIVPISLAIRLPLSCIPLGFLLGDALVFLSSVVAGAEGLGPWRSVRRSISLTRRSFGSMIAVVLGGLVISQLLRVSFYTGPVLLAGTFTADDAALTAISQAGSLVVLVAEPLTACIAARAYLDLRCRHEGLDLRRRVREQFGVVGAPA